MDFPYPQGILGIELKIQGFLGEIMYLNSFET